MNLPQIEIPCPPSPRVVVDAGYALGNLRVTREYPEGRGLVNGEKLASDGLEISARVRATDIVTVGYRHEHTGLRNAMYMATKRMGEDQRYTDFVDGKAQYRELYGSFTLPRTRGHALIVGVAGTSMEYDVEYQTLVFAPPLPGRGEREAEYLGTKNVNAWFRTSYFGLVVGGEGRQNLDELTFDYAARWQPRSLRKNDRESSEKENEYDALDQTATGTELRGGVTWNFAEHVGLNVTGELQRLKTPGENRYYIDENQTIKKVTVGIRLSF
ncbi:MAG: hypothetical protein A2816_00540 [Candidatus Yanofskybacteria bacterium RIFCSPHIGHO2_01_FULL_39_44]|nr:MAG: hypothetical protein A2816_00540 [Candidatus Yanofskybacteria bacterium RIFCSPHIGHO2_01_FULL_39_44]